MVWIEWNLTKNNNDLFYPYKTVVMDIRDKAIKCSDNDQGSDISLTHLLCLFITCWSEMVILLLPNAQHLYELLLKINWKYGTWIWDIGFGILRYLRYFRYWYWLHWFCNWNLFYYSHDISHILALEMCCDTRQHCKCVVISDNIVNVLWYQIIL